MPSHLNQILGGTMTISTGLNGGGHKIPRGSPLQVIIPTVIIVYKKNLKSKFYTKFI